MTTEESIFAAALTKRTAAERAAYLDCVCAGDDELRLEVDALLHAHELPAGILESSRGGWDDGNDMPHASERIDSTIGQYKLLEQIGGGGMGVVYMAEQLKPVRRRVALKVIRPGMDTRQVIARFEAERQALAMMEHPNIAKVFDAGATESGRPYFVMELVPGVPITEYCDRHQLPTTERLGLFMQVCQAVQHAHTKGVIHRDLKPSNVLVMVQDDRPVPKVIDFGVAKATAAQLSEATLFTHFAQMVGTPLYMSPEQAQMGGIDVDTRSDVYSLGVLLYELLTGTTPFDRQRLGKVALDEVRRIIREEDPPRPSTRLSTAAGSAASVSAGRGPDLRRLSGLVRGELDWIVMKALEKDRTRRYETANGLATDVRRYLQNEAVQACPPSARYRLQKLVRRNRGPVVAAAVVVVALLGGIVGTTLGIVRATAAKREAQANRDRAERERDAAISAGTETFDALIDLTDFIDQNLLFDQREPTPDERAFLQRMAARYERLAAHSPGGAQPQDADRGMDAWRRAADLYRGMPPAKRGETPAQRSQMQALARRCRSIALAAEKLHRWPEASEFARQQLEYARAALVPGQRPDRELYNLLLTGNWSLTISATMAGRHDEAVAPWEELLRLIAWIEFNGGACTHLSDIRFTLTASGRAADPAAVLAPGMAERHAKLKADPSAAQARTDLRRAYRVLGLLHEKSRDFAKALEAYDQVLALGDAPPSATAAQIEADRQWTDGTLIGRAVCLDALDRQYEAEIAWEAWYKARGGSAADGVMMRMLHLAKNGQPERAVELAQATLLQRGRENPYNAACVFAVASDDAGLSPDRKEEFAARAIALLENAMAAGFFDDPNIVAHAKSDGDLDPIRGRNDFMKLVTRLEAAVQDQAK